MMKPVSSSKPSLKVDDDTAVLRFPDFSEETCRLMGSPAPSFEQQIAHATMLLRWRQAQGIPDDRMEGNSEPFRL